EADRHPSTQATAPTRRPARANATMATPESTSRRTFIGSTVRSFHDASSAAGQTHRAHRPDRTGTPRAPSIHAVGKAIPVAPRTPALETDVVLRDVSNVHERCNLVALVGAEPTIVAQAGYVRSKGDRAEVAFAVADTFQGRGISTILLGQLAEIAHAVGVTTFDASVLSENNRMIGVFRESGFKVSTHASAGGIDLEFPTSLLPEAIGRFARRDQMAATAALEHVLAPRSVAVIGASRTRGTIGAELFHNLVGNGFNGPVYPVNPSAPVVQSVVAYPTVIDIPGPVDLAVIAVAAIHVVETAHQCAVKGVRSLVV